jgi:hypothetical protein
MKEETQQPSDNKSELDRQQEEYMAQFQNEKGEHDHGKFQNAVHKLFEIGKAKEKKKPYSYSSAVCFSRLYIDPTAEYWLLSAEDRRNLVAEEK